MERAWRKWSENIPMTLSIFRRQVKIIQKLLRTYMKDAAYIPEGWC